MPEILFILLICGLLAGLAAYYIKKVKKSARVDNNFVGAEDDNEEAKNTRN